MRQLRLLLGAVLLLILPFAPRSLAAPATMFDVEIPAGANFAIAAFRWWHPPDLAAVRAVLVLVPGSNTDGRADVADPRWQAFARAHGVALVACHFTDHPHADMAIEAYARAGDGSGQALLDAIAKLAASAGHPEAAAAPLLLWGHSAGGEFNYEFACWQPARVAAFVVNKGGYYFTHLAPAATRAVPGIFFIGERDEAFRIESIRGIFAVNYRAGARWRLVVENGIAHEVGRSAELAAEFFATALATRR